MRYIVMERHPGYVVLLDEEGRFVKAADFSYTIGETIVDPVLMREERASTPHFRWKPAVVSLMAACVLLVVGFFGYDYYVNNQTLYSSIYLRINPEVRMDLNRRGNVIHLEGTNADGKALLEGYEGYGKDKLTVSDALIDRAIEMGYLSAGGQIAFSIDAPQEALFQEYGAQLRSEVEEHLKGQEGMTVVIIAYGDSIPTTSGSGSSTQAPAGEETVNASDDVQQETRPENTPPTPSKGGSSQSGSSAGTSDYGDGSYGDHTPTAPSTPVTPPKEEPIEADSSYEEDDEEGDSGYESSTENDSAYEGASGYDD